jgi:hypothetical protein
MNRVLPVKVSVIQVGLASGGGWARLTPIVRRFLIILTFEAEEGISVRFANVHHKS